MSRQPRQNWHLLTILVTIHHQTSVASLDIKSTTESSRFPRTLYIYKHVSVRLSVRSHSKEEACKDAKHHNNLSRLWTALFHLLERGSDRQRIYPQHSMKWKDVMKRTNTHAAGRLRYLNFSNQHCQYYHIRASNHWSLSQYRPSQSTTAK